MPQLDPSHFSSQIFWLAICFTILFIAVWKIFAPKIDAILEHREQMRNANSSDAVSVKAKIDELEKKIHQQMLENKAELLAFKNTLEKEFTTKAHQELTSLNDQIRQKADVIAKELAEDKNALCEKAANKLAVKSAIQVIQKLLNEKLPEKTIDSIYEANNAS